MNRESIFQEQKNEFWCGFVIHRFVLALLFLFVSPIFTGWATEKNPQFNIVIILADDLGYSDLGCFGGEKLTPNIDKLADSGMRFTDCYASPICSPSRASLLTGCYPQRVGIPGVIGRNSEIGINPDEKLLPEMLKEQGYTTALLGKWHLGDHAMFHPQQHGFDEFFGTLASNDMGFDMDLDSRRYGHCGFYLFDGLDTVTVNPDQWKLVKDYTEKSVDFISRNHDKPFFLYLSHNMPHTPIFVSKEFAGKSKIDLYHDVLMEIDWSVGQVVKALNDFDILDKTLVVFLSDNGPWLIFGNHGGTASPLSGGKRQTLEGGVRIPVVISLPKMIPMSTECNQLITMMDFYPTIAELTHSEMTKDKVDGKSILPLMKQELNAKSPHEAFYYYHVNALQAVRSGNYKLQLPHPDRGAPDDNLRGYDGMRGKVKTVNRPLALYHLKDDPGEENDISNENPDMVKKLMLFADSARRELGDPLLNIKGSAVRSPGKVN